MLRKRIAALAVVCAATVPLSFSAVSSVEVSSKTNVQNGAYECITGKAHFAIDPKLGPNRIIADVDLAPKDSRGLVEFSADYYILRPRAPAKENGTALVEISNRGGKALAHEFGDAFLLEQGFTLVWVGWEFDLPPRPGLLRAYLPIATNHGKTIEGIVRSEWTGNELEQTIPLGDKGQPVIPFSIRIPQTTNYLFAMRCLVRAR